MFDGSCKTEKDDMLETTPTEIKLADGTPIVTLVWVKAGITVEDKAIEGKTVDEGTATDRVKEGRPVDGKAVDANIVDINTYWFPESRSRAAKE